MRTIVDIPENDVKALDALGEKANASRAELVRRAVTDYLASHQEGLKKTQKELLDQYFGMMKGSSAFDNMDGLAWQKRMRAEEKGREADMDRRLAESRAKSLHDQDQAAYKDKP